MPFSQLPQFYYSILSCAFVKKYEVSTGTLVPRPWTLHLLVQARICLQTWPSPPEEHCILAVIVG